MSSPISKRKTQVTKVQKPIQIDLQNKLENFFEGRYCINHEKNKSHPIMVCIDSKCTNKGLICQNCLTIQGLHRGHVK